MPAERGPAERARLAAEALAQAQADARARGESPPSRRRPGISPMPGTPAPAATSPGPAAGPAGPPAPAPPGSSVSPGSPGLPGSPASPGVHTGSGSPASPAGSASPLAAGGRAAAGAGRPRRGRREDPDSLRAAIGGLLDERGWRDELAVGAMFGRWGQIVGPELAAHTHPDGFADGELLVTADSTTWATQLRLLSGTLVARLNAELGGNVVRRVKVRGPAPPPRAGGWRVRGARGPRGDYG